MDVTNPNIRATRSLDTPEITWPEVEIGHTRTPAVLRVARLLALLLLLGATFTADLGHVIAASATWVGLCLLSGDDL